MAPPTPISEYQFKIPKKVLDQRTKTLIAIDRGRYFTEFAFVPRDKIGTTLVDYPMTFQVYANTDFEECLRFLNTFASMPIDGTIRITGDCGETYKDVVEEITGLTVEFVKPCAAAERGLQVIINSLDKNSWFHEPTNGYPEDFQSPEMEKIMSKMELRLSRHDEQTRKSNYPCLLSRVDSETINLSIKNPNQYSTSTVDSVIGGTTLLGLSKLILGTNSYSELAEISDGGACANVSTTLGDIIKEEPHSLFSRLPYDVGLHPFGKLADPNFDKDSCRQKDLAAAIISLVATHVGHTVGSTMMLDGLKLIFMCGQAISIKYMRILLIEYMRMYINKSGNIHFLKINPAPLGAMIIKLQKPPPNPYELPF